MTTEQLKELAEALSILSAQSSVMKERTELRALMEENVASEEVGIYDMYAVCSGDTQMRSFYSNLTGFDIAIKPPRETNSYYAHQN